MFPERNAEHRLARDLKHVVDQHIEPTELGLDAPKYLPHVVIVGVIAAQGDAATSAPCHFVSSVANGARALEGSTRNHDGHARIAQRERHTASDAAARPGDERELRVLLSFHERAA